MGSAPGRLPKKLSTFVGREREFATLRDLVGRSRLVTVTGAGGCGKTRLAIEVATHEEDRFDDVYWIDLSTANAGDVDRAFADAFGLQESRPLVPRIATKIGGARALCIADNCEHVVSDASAILAELLARCDHLRVVATSRVRLDVEGETLYRVPSLATPDETSRGDLLSFDAVRLFVERAQHVRPDLELAPETLEVVAAICRRLDGIPLALELAAARVDVRTLGEIAAGLDDRFRTLRRRPGDRVSRQQTLEASVRWSFDLLNDALRSVLIRLCVFVGGCTLDAARAVAFADGTTEGDALDAISTLVDHSLVEVDLGGPSRYRLLETIRAYGMSQLRPDVHDEIRDRHLAYFRTFVQEAERVFVGPDVASAYVDLLREHENLIAGLSWATGRGNGEAVAAITTSPYWILRGRSREALGYLEPVLNDESLPAPLAARAALVSARLWLDTWDLTAARKRAEQALEIAKKSHDESSYAAAAALVGTTCLWMGMRQAAATAFEEARRAAERIRDERVLAEVLVGLAQVPFESGDLRAARDLLMLSADLARRTGNVRQLVEALNYIFLVTWFLGRDDEALAACAEGREVSHTFGHPFGESVFRSFEAGVEFRLGRLDHARELLAEARVYADLSDHPIAFAQWQSQRALSERATGDAAAQESIDAVVRLAVAFRVPIAAIVGAAYRAELACLDGDVQRARDVLSSVSELAPELARPPGLIGWAEGLIALTEGDVDSALARFSAALVEAQTFGAPQFVIEILESLGCASLERDASFAARLLGAADAAWRERGWRRSSTAGARFEAATTGVRKALEADADTAFDEGARLSLDEAVEYARRGRGPRRRAAEGWGALTPAEEAVVGLVGDGLSNAEVAERMFITVATVKSHLTRAYAKLGVRSRAQLMREIASR